MSSRANLYFNDGDLLLLLGREELRVHKDTISNHSPLLLRKLFRNATEQSENGVSIVAVSEPPAPFKVLLHIMYGNDLLTYFPKLRRMTMQTIAEVLTLVSKYNIVNLDVEKSLRPVIQRDWPEVLEEWDKNEEEIAWFTSSRTSDDASTGDLQGVDDILPEPACVIHYARLHPRQYQDLPFFVTTALYHLSRLPPIADLKDEAMDAEWTETGGRTANTELLTKRDYKSLLIGIDGFRTLISDIALVEFKQHADSAQVPQAEKEVMMRWWFNFGMAIILGADKRDPIGDLLELYNALEAPGTYGLGGASPQYRRQMATWVKRRREELWKSLPSYFNDWQFFADY